jgi:sec-independent protein translocase protein TatA
MNLGIPEMVFLVLIALMLFGPRQIAGIARELGKFVAEFKRASNDFQAQIHQEINKLELEETAKSVAAGTDILPTADANPISSALSRLTDHIKTIQQDVQRDYDA